VRRTSQALQPSRNPVWVAAGIAVAGAVMVLVGVAGGWTATRLLGAQSPLTTVNVTTAGTPLAVHRDDLGFTISAPADWAEYRDVPADGAPSVSFLSPDATELLTVAREQSAEVATRVGDGATIYQLQPVSDVVGGPAGAVQLSYRNDARTSWRMVVPGPPAVWSVTLTVPRVGAGSRSAELFDELARGFDPTTA
jgi:hypothetical protein